MRRYLVVVEKSGNGFGAYAPDLPGCVAVGATREETEEKMYEAITFHLEGMKEDGMIPPEGESFAEYVAIPESTRKTAGVAEKKKKYG